MTISALVVGFGSIGKRHLEILKNFSDKIRVIKNEQNRGITYNRNLAINSLKTKYVASVDADVVLAEDWMERQFNLITNKSVTLVCGRMYEKFINNPYNLWRSIRLKQHWGENDLPNPPMIFGCNNLIDTSNLDLSKIYKNIYLKGDYFKLNGDDNELSKELIKMNFILH